MNPTTRLSEPIGNVFYGDEKTLGILKPMFEDIVVGLGKRDEVHEEVMGYLRPLFRRLGSIHFNALDRGILDTE